LRELAGDAVRNQVGGYVLVTADLPIFGIQIFGTRNDRALANIPAQ
jgi:hypothetical protein